MNPIVIDSNTGDNSFKVYWNVPTFQANHHGIYFTDLTDKYEIIQNDDDQFRGNQIALLYDPGNFPALLKKEEDEDFFFRNGGVPQEGDLDLHLEHFKESISKLIPDETFNGLGIVDFESWRPIFRQNFGALVPYKDVSFDIERKNHPEWTEAEIREEAKKRFEENGPKYMDETIALAKKLRPHVNWGYYAYPYCFNMNTDQKRPCCPDEVVAENDSMQWLWDTCDLLVPSVYFGRKKLNPEERLQLVKGRVEEAKRLQEKTNVFKPIYIYFWFKYQDDSNEFLTQEDMYNCFEYLSCSGVAGVIIWGSSSDVNTKDKCLLLREYVDNVLGPIAKEFIRFY